MAVVEIAKIQVRRGQENQTGVPQLDGGEFGWAADTENLYIGLKIEDGGSRDANVRILTENDERNFFALGVTSSTYTYRLGSYITAENGFSEEVERTVQEKLDDFVNFTDFGGVGDAVNDETRRLQLAVDRLFLDTLDFEGTTGRHPGKKLFVPAGTYNITATIYVPRYTTIVGEGIDKTVFNVVSTGTHAFQTCDYRSQGGEYGYIHFDNTATINSLDQPKGVYFEDMTIKYDVALSTVTSGLSLLSLDCANDAVVKRVKFKGWHSPGDSSVNSYAGVDIRGFGEVTSENVLIDNCQFEGLHDSVKSNYDIINPIVQNSEFNDCRRGVVFNYPKHGSATVGPRYAKIKHNKFENIEEQAIYSGVGGDTFHVSQNNTFINVGNYFNQWGERSSTGTAVISFLSNNNASIDDHFDRYQFQLDQKGATLTYNPLVEGHASIDSSSVTTATLVSSSATSVVRLPITGYTQHINIKYNVMQEGFVDRMGTVVVLVRSGSNPSFVVTDDYTFNTGEGAVSWNVVVDSGYKYLEVNATNSDTSNYIIEYQTKIML